MKANNARQFRACIVLEPRCVRGDLRDLNGVLVASEIGRTYGDVYARLASAACALGGVIVEQCLQRTLE